MRLDLKLQISSIRSLRNRSRNQVIFKNAADKLKALCDKFF